MLVTDEFMEAVRDGAEFMLRSPKDGSERGKVDARSLFQKLVETRLATGEPYIIFIDQVNRSMPKHHRDLGLKVSTSNLCSEITLPTGRDHLGADRTAVCCLSSLNLETWDEWNGDKQFIEDVMRFLDNVLHDYIDRAPDEMARAKYSAERERSVGLGVMGFHSFLQARGLPFEGAMAKSWNLRIFKHIRAQVDEASMMLAQERGPCPDAADMGVMERFSCKMAIAPTASISIICGGTSACIEPIPANIYTHKTLSGSFSIKNPYLEKLLDREVEEQRHGVELDPRAAAARSSTSTSSRQEEKDVYKTSFEIDQRWLLELAADRTPYIDQAQSLNLFIPADVDKWDLMMLHFRAWELGIKSLYYLRSKSVQRAGFAGGVEADNTPDLREIQLARPPTMTSAWRASDARAHEPMYASPSPSRSAPAPPDRRAGHRSIAARGREDRDHGSQGAVILLIIGVDPRDPRARPARISPDRASRALGRAAIIETSSSRRDRRRRRCSSALAHAGRARIRGAPGERSEGDAMLIAGMMVTAFGLLMAGFAIAFATVRSRSTSHCGGMRQ